MGGINPRRKEWYYHSQWSSPDPPVMEGTLNYFDSSPQVRLSHFQPKEKLLW